jgi:hypothetical protein
LVINEEVDAIAELELSKFKTVALDTVVDEELLVRIKKNTKITITTINTIVIVSIYFIEI